MTVNGRRRFISNTGKRYYVSDMCKQDIKGEEKYNLEVEKDGKQRFVLYNEIAIETMW